MKAPDLRTLVRINHLLLILASVLVATTIVSTAVALRLWRAPARLEDLSRDQRITLAERMQRVSPHVYQPFPVSGPALFYRMTPGTRYDNVLGSSFTTNDLGFREVGFAPVTTSPTRGHAISDAGYGDMLSQFRDLAYEFLEASVANQHHGFSNVKETLEELHKGVSKAFPCGAGLGLLGVATDGDVALCHRFAGSDSHQLGTVRDGIDRQARQAFLEQHHVANKTDCRACWARPLCSGGCYHEAFVHYGSTSASNLHYCDWIRGWNDLNLRIYGEIALKNPSFLDRFNES
jgi:radical SAM protein with 4Fe4S-binding SPASM domain